MWELGGPDCAAVVALSRDRILGTPTSGQDPRSAVPCGRTLTARPSVAALIWLNEWCSGYGPGLHTQVNSWFVGKLKKWGQVHDLDLALCACRIEDQGFSYNVYVSLRSQEERNH